MDFSAQRAGLGDAAVDALVARALAHASTSPGEDFSEQVRLRARKLLAPCAPTPASTWARNGRRPEP
ncbi:MAG: hypothetical protein ABI895_26360 [Deltaproteobacteria bacterium]